MATKERIVIVTRRVAFRSAGVPSSLIHIVIDRIPPLARTTAIQLQIWWGMNELPADGDLIECHLLALDTINPPDITGVLARADWSAAQKWHANSTPQVTVQTLTHENLLLLGSKYDTVDLGVRTTHNAWVLAVSDTTQNQFYTGTLVVQHSLIIRTHGGDAYTFADEDKNNAEGISDIDMDTDDGDG